LDCSLIPNLGDVTLGAPSTKVARNAVSTTLKSDFVDDLVNNQCYLTKFQADGALAYTYIESTTYS